MSRMRKAGQYLGLVYADGESVRGARESRYSRGRPATSPRLDDDIDDLRAELAALTRRVAELERQHRHS